ncbi:hypothetical protein [Rubinisphaera margarita]|uniref:hypothetical protein n=1 Tax=Rubinisphaera margarita TaxID=2909586 RepID=UPI001EE8F372|nr:hypothetical protein [Rubinisphaera margarita]MCG6157105.1 hypothetical protein [Rubinisphaera margarita]
MGRSFEAASLFTLSAEGYEKGAAQIIQANSRISASNTKMANSADQVNQRMGKFQNIAQQAAFGLEDFTLASSTGGMAAGFRGAANNISMIALSLGGVKTVLLTVGAMIVGSVLKPISSWMQKTETLAGLHERLEQILTRIEQKRIDLQLSREAEDAAKAFSKLDSIDGMFDQISERQLVSKRATEDLDLAKQSLREVLSLRDKLTREDLSEGQRKGIFTRGLASINPAFQEVVNAFTGSKENLWGNTKEIKDAFQQIEAALQKEIASATTRAKSSESILQKMVELSPQQAAQIVRKSVAEMEKAFESEGLGLERQLDQELDTIGEKYDRLRQKLNDLKASDATAMTDLGSLQAREEDLARRRFKKQIDERNDKLRDSIDSFASPIMDPIQQEFRRIADEAGKLRRDVLNWGLPADQEDKLLDRIDQIEQKRLDRAIDGNNSNSRLGAIYAGSDAALASIRMAGDRQKELGLLSKIERNTHKRPGDITLEVIG